MFRIEITRDLACLLADSDLWNGLARGVPFRETSWLGPWWRQFGQNRQAHVLVARDDGGAIRGILPLYRRNHLATGRTLSMIGDGDACSDHVSVLARDADAVEIAGLMGKHLAQSASNRETGWDLIDIDGVVQGDGPMSALAQALKAGGAALHTQSGMSTWYKPRDSSWTEHLKQHGKTQRRRMRRWSEKIEQDENMEKLVAQTDRQVDELLGSLIELHQRRWNADGQPGSYADPRFREFISESVKDFCRRGRLYLTGLKYAGRLIGGELHLIGGDRIMYCYSSGYDIDAGDLEPGRILCVDSLMHLYRQQLAGVDYMRGDEEYKKRMSTCSRRLLRLRAVAPTWLPRIRHAAWCTRFELRQWMRRHSGRPPIEVLDITQLSTSESQHH